VSDFDVLIAGAGPAACATAISLATLTPTLKVCVVGVPRSNGPPPLEVLSPLVTPFIRHLGLWPTFVAAGHDPSFCTSSAWSSSQVSTNDSVFNVHGTGWKIDRAAFDDWLAAEAGKRSTAFLPAKVVGLQNEAGAWTVDCGISGIHRARFVVDATGRAAVLARKLGYRPPARDRLTAYFVYLHGKSPGLNELLIESVAEGWWYTAVLSDGRCLVACMTDSDIGADLDLRTRSGWTTELSRTRFVAKATTAFKMEHAPSVWPACTRGPFTYDDRNLLCIGDAAACFDPISGQGTTRAIRSGLFASYAITDTLIREDDRGITRFRSLHTVEYDSYLKTRRDYYGSERRWPEHLFWRRRHR
jgi:flavin-dependent dehydrogenase